MCSQKCLKYAQMRDFPHDCGTVDSYDISVSRTTCVQYSIQFSLFPKTDFESLTKQAPNKLAATQTKMKRAGSIFASV